MGVYKEGKNWKVQVYYKDWQGNRKRKQKRGFRTKGEAKEWERDFLQQQSQGVDIEFGNFLEIYYKDMDVRLRENTMYTKRYIIDLKIKPYFEKKILSEITVADVRAWQNELLTYKDKNGKGYSPTYLKTVNCQLTAIFNYAMRYYNLQDNPCRKAGAIGKSKGEPKDFWMQEEFNAFLETVSDKPETRMAFLLLYWTGMRIGELLALTYNDINLEEKTISINKSYQRLKGKDMITQPKTPKSIRVITMPDFLAEEFREYCSHLYGIMKKERLFRFTKSHMEHCMAMDLLTGWVDISKYEGVTSPDYRVFVLNDKNGMCPKYYLYMMQMCYSARIFYGLGQGVSGMGRWRLQADKFLNFYIPIPPYDEQKKIADYITDKVNHIEVEIDKRNKLIKKYQEYKKSLIYEVVTGKKEV